MELIKLKEYVYQKISSLVSINVYDTTAPLEATFPYVVFNFASSSYTMDTRADWILEINIWDDTNDDTVILEQSQLIKSGLSYMWQSEDEGFYSSYIDFEGIIPTEERDMSHINQRYLLQTR